VPVPTLGVLAGMLPWPGAPSGAALFLAAKVWILLFPALWHLLVDRQPPGFSPMRRGGIGAGIVSGLVLSAVVVGAYRFLGDRLIDRGQVLDRMTGMGLTDPAVYLGAAAYWICVNSVIEEYVWRWFVVSRGEVLVGPRLAAPLSAALFTLHHTVAMSLYLSPAAVGLASAGVFAAGAVWSWSYVRYRSVWPGYLSHAMADLAIFGVGYDLLFRGPLPPG
jgi:membrane protease YdiL (CAAX protease family)